jgi:hypothetical protein
LLLYDTDFMYSKEAIEYRRKMKKGKWLKSTALGAICALLACAFTGSGIQGRAEFHPNTAGIQTNSAAHPVPRLRAPINRKHG